MVKETVQHTEMYISQSGFQPQKDVNKTACKKYGMQCLIYPS